MNEKYKNQINLSDNTTFANNVDARDKRHSLMRTSNNTNFADDVNE